MFKNKSTGPEFRPPPTRRACSAALLAMQRGLLALLCACTAHAAETDYSKLKIVTLKRMLFVRGVECTHCTSKAEWVAHMQLHAELPEREELAAEWVAQKEYARKAKELSMTRDEFLKQMNETEGARADRLWAVRRAKPRATHTPGQPARTPCTRHTHAVHTPRAARRVRRPSRSSCVTAT